MVNRQLQIVNIKLGNLRTVQKDLSKENRDLEKQNDKLHKDILKALGAKSKAQSAAASAKSGRTAQKQRADGLEGRLNQANTDKNTLNNQLGAATNAKSQYETLYNDTLAKLGTTSTERDSLKLTVKDKEADLKVEQAGRAADNSIANANKAKELADKDKDYGIQIAQKDGALAVKTAEADKDLKVEQAGRAADGQVAAANKSLELASQKATYEVQISGKDAELKVKIAEADRDRKVETAENKTKYLKRLYLAIGTGIAAVAIAATGMYAIGRSSAPTIEQKVEEKAPKTEKPSTTAPATAPSTATTPSTTPTPAIAPSTTPTPSVTIPTPAITPSTPKDTKYMSIEARVEGSWYEIEPGKIASEYRIAARNKTLDGVQTETIKSIQYEAIHGEEGVTSLFGRLKEIEKRDLTPKEYSKILDKLPYLDTASGGDLNTITKADAAKANELAKKGGLKAILGE